MESLHNTRLGTCDTRAVACLTINSRYTAGGRARIVYDALADEIFTAWRYALFIRATEFVWQGISRKRLEIGIYFSWNKKKQEIASSIQWHHFNDLRWSTDKYTTFLSHDAMLARYILCDGSVLVRLSVLLRAEGPRDANSCRGTRRDVVVHAAYCYRLAAVAWSVRPCGLLRQTRSSGVVDPSMRPIATDAQQWRGRSTHAANCYWGYGRTTGWPTYRLCLA